MNDLCFKYWKVNFRSIRRTNNKVADCLTKIISDDIDHLVALKELPSKIKISLKEDIRSSALVNQVVIRGDHGLGYL
ncbi:hypothetical protein Golob_027690, partial [Gossypium lobatum]|nr:hypothetical protein [Gossypium lobatum]